MATPKKSHKVSIEKLSHFQCGSCRKWWTIGDAPTGRTLWHCPWCGTVLRVQATKRS